MIAAIVLTATLVEIDLIPFRRAVQRAHHQQAKPPRTTCGIVTVGYRFEGKPGTEVRYARETYTIPEGGTLELIASPREIPHGLDPRHDQFGFCDVPMRD